MKRIAIAIWMVVATMVLVSCGSVQGSPNTGDTPDGGRPADQGECSWDHSNWDGCNWTP